MARSHASLHATEGGIFVVDKNTRNTEECKTCHAAQRVSYARCDITSPDERIAPPETARDKYSRRKGRQQVSAGPHIIPEFFTLLSDCRMTFSPQAARRGLPHRFRRSFRAGRGAVAPRRCARRETPRGAIPSPRKVCCVISRTHRLATAFPPACASLPLPPPSRHHRPISASGQSCGHCVR